jgi:hypothetical protein
MPLVGCSDTESAGGSAGDGGSAGVGGGGAGGDGGVGGVGGTAELLIFTGDWNPDAPPTPLPPPLEGVEVCEADTTNCDVTDTTGFATLWLPRGEVVLTLNKDGYSPLLGSEVVPPHSGLYTSFPPDSVERVSEQMALVGSPYPDESTGRVSLTVYRGRPEFAVGATLELIPEAGKGYYADENNDLTTELTATTSAGFGGFSELEPGEYQIEVGGDVGNCEVYRGWLGDAPNRVRFAVRAGHGTKVRVDCE